MGEVFSLQSKAISWDRLVTEASLCPSYGALVNAVLSGADDWPVEVWHLRKFREEMSVIGGVVTYQGKSVIPLDLRLEVLSTLHSGHQGMTSMWGRASSAVWWPGMFEDITRIRAQCWRCDSNALSQPKEPPVPLPSVEYPFQQICSDYFLLKGKQYLIMVDRYSGWLSIYKAKSADDGELIRLLRTHCETFGVPEELAMDGGSVYTSHRTQAFLFTWGIRHRLSSAYNHHGKLRLRV